MSALNIYMESLGSLINKRIQVMKVGSKIQASLVLEKFNALLLKEFGSGVKTRARAVYLKDDCLCVAVTSSVMAQELKFREKRLVQEVNKELAANIVTKIRCLC